jgi:hypothetical protein
MSGSELRSGRNLEFGVDVSRVKLDGPEAHREPFGGLPVGQPGSDELCAETAKSSPPAAASRTNVSEARNGPFIASVAGGCGAYESDCPR